MSNNTFDAESDETCAALTVTLFLDEIKPLCMQHDNQTLRDLLRKNSKVIAAHMVSAGILAAVKLFNQSRGAS